MHHSGRWFMRNMMDVALIRMAAIRAGGFQIVFSVCCS